MGLISRLVALPATGPAHGVWWVLQKLTAAAEAEFYNPAALKTPQVALEMQLEAGDMTEDDYEEQEIVLLTRLKEARSKGR